MTGEYKLKCNYSAKIIQKVLDTVFMLKSKNTRIQFN